MATAKNKSAAFKDSIEALKAVGTRNDKWDFADALLKDVGTGNNDFDDFRDAAALAGLKVPGKASLRASRDTAAKWPAKERVDGVSFTAHRASLPAGDDKKNVLEALAKVYGPSKVKTKHVHDELVKRGHSKRKTNTTAAPASAGASTGASTGASAPASGTSNGACTAMVHLDRLDTPTAIFTLPAYIAKAGVQDVIKQIMADPDCVKQVEAIKAFCKDFDKAARTQSSRASTWGTAKTPRKPASKATSKATGEAKGDTQITSEKASGGGTATATKTRKRRRVGDVAGL